MTKVLQKAINKELLSPKEVNKLAASLGIKASPLKKVSYVINFFVLIFLTLLALGFVFEGIDYKIYKYMLFIPIGYLIIIICIYNFAIKYDKKILTYFEAIDSVYKQKLAPYDGFEIMKCANFPSPKGLLQKNVVIFISDGYNFVVYDDFLKPTSFILGQPMKTKENKVPILKVLDESINKEPFIFKIQDVESYRIHLDKRKPLETDYSFTSYCKMLSPLEYKSYVEILLKGNIIIKLGINVASVLQKTLPMKEVTNDKQTS